MWPAPVAVAVRLRTVLLGVVGAIAAAAVVLSRTAGPGALNSIWIEDASLFLNHAYWFRFSENIFNSNFGYYHTGPRLMAEVAVLMPVRWAAPTLTLFAAGMYAIFTATVYVASRPHLSHWWLRVLAAAPVVAVPVGHTQADNDVATLQFPALYALFWLLLWRPSTRLGRVGAVSLMLYITFSSILPVVFAPLVLLRLVLVRDWCTRLIAIAFAAGMTLQFGGSLLGEATRSTVCCRKYEPLWVVDEYLTKGVPRAVLGERWLGGPGIDNNGFPVTLNIPSLFVHYLLIAVAWSIVLAAVVLAVRRVTRPHWPLAILAGGFSFVLFAAQITNIGNVQPRYVIAPALLIYTALLALLRPAPLPTSDGVPDARRSRYPDAGRAVTAFATLLVVVCAVNLSSENGRSQSQGWDETVRQARTACAADPARKSYAYGRDWWNVEIPCRRMR